MKGMEGVDFHYDVLRHQRRDVNVELLAAIEKEKADVTLIVLFKDDFDPQVLENVLRQNSDLIALDHSHFSVLSGFAFPVLCRRPELRDRYICSFRVWGWRFAP